MSLYSHIVPREGILASCHCHLYSMSYREYQVIVTRRSNNIYQEKNTQINKRQIEHKGKWTLAKDIIPVIPKLIEGGGYQYYREIVHNTGILTSTLDKTKIQT